MFSSKELAEVANKISLTLNGLESVKRQGRNIIAVKDQLKTFHQQISAAQENFDPIPFPIAELEKYPKLQQRLNTIEQRNPAHIEDTALLKLLIESLVVECNQSIALANKYLKNPEATLAQVGKQTAKTTKSTTQSRTHSRTHSSPSQPTRSPTPPVKTQTTRTRAKTNPITTPKQRSRQFTSTQLLTGLAIAIAIAIGGVFGLIWGESQQALGLGIIVGLALGLGTGLVLTQSSGHHSQGAPRGFLRLPTWQSLVGSVLVAMAIGAMVNPTVSLFYARRIGLEPWHPNYPQVGASPGIKLYSDLPFPEQDAKLQRFLENFRATVGARFLATGPESCSVDVYLLRKESNYNAILQTFHANTPFGFFTTVPGQPTLFVRDGSGLGTLTHEMMHHFLHCTFPSTLPTWVDEGVATLMEKFIAIEFNGKLAFSWGYRSNWRDREVRNEMEMVNLTAALEAGRDQSLFNALFLMLYHQNRLEPLLTQIQTKSDETGIPTLMATLNLSMPEIQQQLQKWMQTEALELPMLERSFVAWANETMPVNQYLSQNWQWHPEKQMWFSPQPDLWATIPSKEEILSN
jgi:ABC-type nickel/cobalt efflux system permease component RcnA